jgi:hypothetical protein
MYAIYGNIYHPYTPNLSIYIYHTWILWLLNINITNYIYHFHTFHTFLTYAMTAFLPNASIVHPCSPQDASCQPQLTQKEGNSRGTPGDTTEKSWLCMVMPLCLVAHNKEKSRGWGEKEMEKESKSLAKGGLGGTWWDMMRHDKRVPNRENKWC